MLADCDRTGQAANLLGLWGLSMTNSEDEKTYPSVAQAYSFVVPSYQFMLSRYEAADNRLTALTTAASGFAGLAPAVGKLVGPSVPFNGWFFVSLGLLVSAAIVGLWARTRGGIALPNPRRIAEKQLHWSVWEFQKNAIIHAGEAFDQNAAIVRRKGNYAVCVMALIALGLVAFSAWLVA
jgi:hypothetical protein